VRRETARNVLWSATEAAVSGALSFVSVFVVARLIGPAELGIGAAAVATHVLLWVAVNGLFADAMVQRRSADIATLSTAVWASAGVGVLAALLQAAAGWPLAAWLGDERLRPMCLLLAVPLPLVGAGGVMQGMLTLRRDYRRLAWRTLAGQGLGSITGIAAACLHAGAWAPVLQQLVVSSVGALALLIGAGERPRAILQWRILCGLLGVGVPLTASTLVLACRYRLFAILIGGTAGARVLGEVHMAFRLVETVRELAFTAQWRLMLPLLVDRQHDQAALRAACDRMLALSGRIMLPLCGAMALVLPAMVHLVLGPAWDSVGRAGAPLIALMALLTLMFPSSVALVARGDTTRQFVGSLLSTGAALAGVVLVQPVHALSATLVWLAAHLLTMPYALSVNGRALDSGPLRPLRAGALVLGVVVAGVLGGSLLPLPAGGRMLWIMAGLERLGVFAAVVLPVLAAMWAADISTSAARAAERVRMRWGGRRPRFPSLP